MCVCGVCGSEDGLAMPGTQFFLMVGSAGWVGVTLNLRPTNQHIPRDLRETLIDHLLRLLHTLSTVRTANIYLPTL